MREQHLHFCLCSSAEPCLPQQIHWHLPPALMDTARKWHRQTARSMASDNIFLIARTAMQPAVLANPRPSASQKLLGVVSLNGANSITALDLSGSGAVPSLPITWPSSLPPVLQTSAFAAEGDGLKGSLPARRGGRAGNGLLADSASQATPAACHSSSR